MNSQGIAVLDLGTNSTRYLAIDKEPGFHPSRILARDSEVTRLGENLEKSGRLSEKAMERVRETVVEYDKKVQEIGARWVDGIATHAFRRAENGEEFLDELSSLLGIRPQLITGEEEAEVIARGIRASLPSRTTCMVMDIGGGSTEWICLDKERTELRSSPVGVVSLREQFLNGEHWEEKAMSGARDRIRQHLPDQTNDGDLVVVGGTGTTLSAYRQKLEEYDSERVHGDEIALAQIKNIRREFASRSVRELAREPMVQPGRADLMIPGILILEEFAENAGVKEIVVSDFGPLAGVLDGVKIHG